MLGPTCGSSTRKLVGHAKWKTPLQPLTCSSKSPSTRRSPFTISKPWAKSGSISSKGCRSCLSSGNYETKRAHIIIIVPIARMFFFGQIDNMPRPLYWLDKNAKMVAEDKMPCWITSHKRRKKNCGDKNKDIKKARKEKNRKDMRNEERKCKL